MELSLSTLRGLRGAPEVPPLCRETQSLGQHMLEFGAVPSAVEKVIVVWLVEARLCADKTWSDTFLICWWGVVGCVAWVA